MTSSKEYAIIPDESCTPWPVYDKSTGRLCLTDGKHVRVIARLNEKGEIFLWWRAPGEKKEVKLSLEDLLKAIL